MFFIAYNLQHLFKYSIGGSRHSGEQSLLHVYKKGKSYFKSVTFSPYRFPVGSCLLHAQFPY
jgi:hypothetical protein